jgi:uncharacterized protein (TIGR00297 family)
MPRARRPLDFAIGAIGAGAIAAFAYRAHALDKSGALAAFAVGTATYGALGFAGSGVLVTFFVTSVGLSRVGKKRKSERLVDVDKTGARDGMQVVANGGVAALCALASLRDARFMPAFAGAFAAAAADTWATEIGTLARGRPRSILTFERIATGLSGGVTFEGTLAEVVGALFVALAARTLVGALSDSVLGASLQSLRWCEACERATERNPHACGADTRPLRGLTWFGNDAVNISATACGALVAGIAAIVA